MIRWMRPIVVVASMLATAGVLELALRAVGYQYSPLQIGANVKDDWRDDHAFGDRNLIYDPDLIWRPKSGQFSPFNPQGFRGATILPHKPPGTFRIFAIGDSNTFGWDVDEGANWPSQLQELFSVSRPGTEVVNAGVWGYSSFQGKRRFVEALAFDPDLVLISFGGNDAHQVAVPDIDYVRRHDRIEYVTRATRRSRLAQLAVASWDGLAARTGDSASIGPRVRLEDYAANLRAIIHDGRVRGVRVVLLTRPFIGSSTDPMSWKTHAPSYNDATVEVGRAEQTPVIDVHGAFHNREELFDDESHFGVEGHRLAARLIHEELLRLLAP